MLDFKLNLYSVDLEVWSKLAKHALTLCIKHIAHDFDCDWERLNMFSHYVNPTRFLLLQIISYSDTKVLVLVVMECKCASLCIRVDIFTSYFKVNRI